MCCFRSKEERYRRCSLETALPPRVWSAGIAATSTAATAGSVISAAARPLKLKTCLTHWSRGRFETAASRSLIFPAIGSSSAPEILLHFFASAPIRILRRSWPVEGARNEQDEAPLHCAT